MRQRFALQPVDLDAGSEAGKRREAPCIRQWFALQPADLDAGSEAGKRREAPCIRQWFACTLQPELNAAHRHIMKMTATCSLQVRENSTACFSEIAPPGCYFEA